MSQRFRSLRQLLRAVGAAARLGVRPRMPRPSSRRRPVRRRMPPKPRPVLRRRSRTVGAPAAAGCRLRRRSAAAATVGPARRQDLLAHPADRRRRARPRRLRPGGPRRRAARVDPLRCPRRRPTASTAVVRPRARPCASGAADRLAHRRQGSRQRAAGWLLRTALDQHRVAGHASRAAADPPAISRPQGRACRSRRGRETAKINRIRLNMDRWRWLPRDLGDKYIIVNVPGFHAPWSRTASTAGAAGGRRRDQDADAAAVGHGDRRYRSIRGGKCRRASPRRSRASRATSRQGQGRQDPALAPAAGPVQRARPAEVRDVQSAEHLSARHQCAQPFQQPDARVEPRLHPHREIVDLATSCFARRRQSEMDAGKDRRGAGQQEERQANFVKPMPVYIVYFSSAAATDGRIVDYEDVYGRDAKAMAALLDKEAGGSAAKVAAQ